MDSDEIKCKEIVYSHTPEIKEKRSLFGKIKNLFKNE
jgi:hypothetical protein